MKVRISAEKAKAKPKYGARAAELLGACRKFYEDPENEKAFREWQARRNRK